MGREYRDEGILMLGHKKRFGTHGSRCSIFHTAATDAQPIQPRGQQLETLFIHTSLLVTWSHARRKKSALLPKFNGDNHMRTCDVHMQSQKKRTYSETAREREREKHTRTHARTCI